MIIAVDFDDTLFAYVPPILGTTDYSGRPGSIGQPIQHVIDWCHQLQREGHQLILWTCREGAALADAIDACDAVGLTFDAINANIRRPDEALHWPDCRKVKADLYIDDKSFNPFQPPMAAKPMILAVADMVHRE